MLHVGSVLPNPLFPLLPRFELLCPSVRVRGGATAAAVPGARSSGLHEKALVTVLHRREI